MTNEAAERLRHRIQQAWPINAVRRVEGTIDLDDALAAERRATVERIRTAVGLDPDKTHDKIMFLDDLAAILDEEAAR